MSSPPRFNEISSIDDNDNSNDNDNDNDTFDSTTGAESLEDTTAWCVCRREELKRIDLIGTGRYCQVHREAIYSSERPPQVVAVKSIDPSKILRNLEAFHTAAGEMANEAGILRQVGHENIVELKGLSPEESFDPESWNPEKSPEMFLVFEVLRGTLSGRLKRWRKVPQSGKSRGRSRGLLSPSATRTIRHTTGKSGRRGAIRSSGRSTTAGVVPTGASSVAAAALLEIGLLHRRIEDTATGIARGMRYLHSRGIVLRDLKPANIGYDQEHNSVRLFDFGMAKKVELCEADEQCGSLRYMAPEVARSDPYNLTADVYGFGLVLWQVCSLELPFDGMNRQDHSDCVVYGNERPEVDPSWNLSLRILMKRAWESDPLKRPAMDSVYKILKTEICALRDGDDSGLEHTRRRSTFVIGRDSMVNKPRTREASSRRMSSLEYEGFEGRHVTVPNED
mmetsp:Transcript_6899/g.13971  ORF Transcript_6899/g.13971 Transcript_6899/m.13971 type:complete len:451 (+) Transcript_6899:215-1567(+)